MHTWISAAAIGVLLAIATAWDVRRSEVPGLLTIGGVAAGLVVRPLAGAGITTSLLGAAVGGALLLTFVLLGGMGSGDAWLMAAIGAWSDWRFVLAAALWSGIAGGVIAAGVFICRCADRTRMCAFPYVPAIALGTAIAWFTR